jgi:hypothetical protein
MNPQAFYLGVHPGNLRRLFWLPLRERWAHMAVWGASGSGKSNLLLDLIMQDIAAGRGCCLIDPKGDLVLDVLAAMTAVPEDAWAVLARDVVVVDPSEPDCPVAFNPLEVNSYGSPSRQRQEMVSVFRKIWHLDDAQTPRLGLVLRRAVQLAMENGLTLCDIQRILTDEVYRAGLVARSNDDSVRTFWEREFPDSPSAQMQWAASTLTRLEALLDDPNVRRMLGQPRSSFDFRKVMDEGKVLLINLAKGRLGQETASLIGGFLLAKLQMAAESRQDIWPPESRRVFYLYVDEFQNYATRSFEEMLAEARGYGLSLVMANQHLAQLDDGLRRAVLSNARIRVAFRMSHEDAALLAQEFWRFQGDRVKETRWDTVRIGRLQIPVPEPVYHSAGDEARQNREALHYLPDRMMWVHIQGQGAPRLLRTVDIPRQRLAASRERVQRFKALLGSSQPRALLEPEEVREVRPLSTRTFEWTAGASVRQP